MALYGLLQSTMKYFKSCCGLAVVAVEAIKLNSFLLHVKTLQSAPNFSICKPSFQHGLLFLDSAGGTASVSKYLCTVDRQVYAFLKLITPAEIVQWCFSSLLNSLESFHFTPYTKSIKAACGNLVGRIIEGTEIQISGKYLLVLLGFFFFPLKSQPN